VGAEDTLSVGASVGTSVLGPSVGLSVGDSVGPLVGIVVGDSVGPLVGLLVGNPVGPPVSARVGIFVGESVGLMVGDPVGPPVRFVGEPVMGEVVGENDGDVVVSPVTGGEGLGGLGTHTDRHSPVNRLELNSTYRSSSRIISFIVRLGTFVPRPRTGFTVTIERQNKDESFMMVVSFASCWFCGVAVVML